jgi:hypothetical protein
MPSALFCFSYILDRIYFGPMAGLHIAGRTGTYHHTQLYLLPWSLANFLHNLTLDCDPLNMHLQITRITGIKYTLPSLQSSMDHTGQLCFRVGADWTVYQKASTTGDHFGGVYHRYLIGRFVVNILYSYIYILKYIVMCLTMFWLTTDRIYDAVPINYVLAFLICINILYDTCTLMKSKTHLSESVPVIKEMHVCVYIYICVCV